MQRIAALVYLCMYVELTREFNWGKLHHMGSTVKSVFFDTSSLYMAESCLSANQHYIKQVE